MLGAQWKSDSTIVEQQMLPSKSSVWEGLLLYSLYTVSTILVTTFMMADSGDLAAASVSQRHNPEEEAE